MRDALRFQDSVSVKARVNAITELVLIQNLSGKPDLAVQTAQTALGSFVHGESPDLFHALGVAELARGNSAGAVTAFRRSTDFVRGLGGMVEASGILYETSLAGALASSNHFGTP